MEKEEINNKENTKDTTEDSSEDQKETKKNSEETSQLDEQSSPQEELDNLKDKLARTFAEMENQRRRYEKEKEDAFEYGGFAFAKEALNLLDNLERSKISLENDEALKNTEALKKVSEHFEIINKDMLSILKKNNIEVFEEEISVDSIYECDELWLTSSTKEIQPVAFIDDYKIPTKKTDQLIWNKALKLFNPY